MIARAERSGVESHTKVLTGPRLSSMQPCAPPPAMSEAAASKTGAQPGSSEYFLLFEGSKSSWSHRVGHVVWRTEWPGSPGPLLSVKWHRLPAPDAGLEGDAPGSRTPSNGNQTQISRQPGSLHVQSALVSGWFRFGFDSRNRAHRTPPPENVDQLWRQPIQGHKHK